MTTGRDLHRRATRTMSVLMVLIGVALVARGLAAGGGAWLVAVLGVLFVAAGLGRLYVTGRAR